MNISAKSGALCPHAGAAAPHAGMSNIPYVLEEFLLMDDCPDPRNSRENLLLKLRLIFFNCFEAYNVAVQRTECRTSPQKINQLFPTLCPFFSAINIERKAGGMKILQ